MNRKGYMDLLEKDVIDALKKANHKAQASDDFVYLNVKDLVRSDYSDEIILSKIKQHLASVRRYEEFNELHLEIEIALANAFNSIRMQRNIYVDQTGVFDDLLGDLIDDKVIEK